MTDTRSDDPGSQIRSRRPTAGHRSGKGSAGATLAPIPGGLSDPARSKRLPTFPAFHKVAGLPVVVAGCGEAAAAKVRLLAETDAEIVLYAPSFGPAETAALAVGARIVRREIAGDDLRGAVLAFAATDDDAADRRIRDLARAAGVPVNVVDRAELCDFYTPSIVNRAPIAIAVCSNGTAPVLSGRVRASIEALLPPALGRVAEIADQWRAAVKIRIPCGPGRRRFWQRFFDGAPAELILEGRESAAAVAAADALEAEAHATPRGAGRVWLVGAGPGAVDLLTLRAQRVLQQADVIVHDRLVPDEIVAMGRRDAERVYVGKAKGAAAATQEEINALLVRRAGAGARVVRLKSGDPLVFGRAGEEMEALEAAGIDYEIVPGVTAALAAAAAARIPLTHRDEASSLVFATGHAADGSILPNWSDLALSGNTVAVYMGRSVAGEVAQRLISQGGDPSIPVAAIENASRPDQRVFTGTLADIGRLAERTDVNGPVLILIGRTARHAVAQAGKKGSVVTLSDQVDAAPGARAMQEGPRAVVAA